MEFESGFQVVQERDRPCVANARHVSVTPETHLVDPWTDHLKFHRQQGTCNGSHISSRLRGAARQTPMSNQPVSGSECTVGKGGAC